MEKSQPVDQRRTRLEAFLELHAERLARQGALVATYRRRGTVRLGPYYQLTCRDAVGRQCAVYLGPASPWVEEIRQRLHILQAPQQNQRSLQRAKRAVRRLRAAANAELDEQLRPLGLWRKGAEVRGWAHAHQLRPR